MIAWRWAGALYVLFHLFTLIELTMSFIVISVVASFPLPQGESRPSHFTKLLSTSLHKPERHLLPSHLDCNNRHHPILQ